MNRNANTIFGFVAAAVLILSGCINNVDTETGGNSNVPDGKCSLTVDSGFSARAAFPSSLAADMVYAAEISYSSSGAEKWLGADSLENSPAVLRNSLSASGEIRFVFCAPEESAEYTITVFACPTGTSVGSAADVENAAAASGQAEFSLKAGQKALETPVKVSLSPTSNVSGKGNVKLPLSFDSALGIVAAEVNVTKDGVSDSGENNYRFKMEVSGSGATLSAENAPAGTYLAIMKFYNSTTVSSSTEVAVNSAVQQVSVYPGMTTDCWFIDGKKHGTTAADGTFTLSALELTKYDFTELYVCGTDGGGESDGKRSFYVSSNFGSSVPLANDTTGDGSMAKPFVTVQKAVDTIAASGDTTKKYTVYVDGTVEPLYADTDFGVSETFISIGTTASNLDLTIKGLSADARAVLNAKQKGRRYGRVLTSENTSLTLENLKITGGKVNNLGGGIYIKSGNLTLKNCVVTKNESSNGGGGIHFGGENLIVENSEISGNNGDTGGICVAEDSAETEIKNCSIKNNVARSGGGLELAGTSTIEDCEITGNKAESYGGGLILALNNKSCRIKKSVINNNTAGGSGGGIYMIAGELRLGSGAEIGEKLDPDVNDISKVATDKEYGNRSTKKITSDTNTDFDVGAGIFVAGGTVFMYEDSYICRNYTECSGGGVFIKEGGQFFMYGGVVGWNRSNFGGGILCQGRLGIHYSSRICYNKVSTQLVQVFCGRGAGIAVDGENGTAQAVIKDNTKIFGNSAVVGVNSSTNTDALGAGIYSSGRLVINGEEIQIYENQTDSDGAAIGIEGGTAMLSGCKISDNSAGRNGGAIFISSVDQNKDAGTQETLAIKKNVSIYSNSATDPNSTAGDGGAIYATTNPSNAAGKCCYVIIGEDKNTEGIVIEDNNAKRGGAFYGADNARFVMNAGKVSGNYSTRTDEGGGGGAMFLWGGTSNYSTFTMDGGEIIGNMAKNGGAGGAVHIDDDSGKNAAFIMTGGLLSGNKTTDEYGNDSKLGGAIYVKKGGQIKLGGSAVIAVSEGNDNCNDIWLATGKTITVTGRLTPENNAAAGNPKYTARITPESYTLGNTIIQGEGELDGSSCAKFLVTANAADELKYKIKYDSSSKTGILATTQNIVINGKEYDKTALEDVIDVPTTITGSGEDGVFIGGRTVTLSPYSIGKYEVTQELFEAVMGKNPSEYQGETHPPANGEIQELRPVEKIRWHHAIVFCNRLSMKIGLDSCYTAIRTDGNKVDYMNISFDDITNDWRNWQSVSCDLTKNGYRLPTAAEWEFAARGGDQSADAWNYTYAGSNNIGDVAWYKDNSDGISHEVGKKNPNSLGLYDMSGNCWEFCWDITFNGPSAETVIDPMGESTTNYRSRPSGSYSDSANDAKVVQRNSDAAGVYAYTNNGFRLARSGFPRAN